MPISIRQDFGSEVAKMVLDDIQFQRGRYYVFLGGAVPWTGLGEEGALDRPISYNLSATDTKAIRSEMVYAKVISPNDAAMAVPRITWTMGTVYDAWDHTIDMTGKRFYVITSLNHVFKCLDNGSRFGEPSNPSTVQPNITSIYTFKTSDGYLWKYMYSVSPYAATRFSTATFMPVKRALSDAFYNNGAIDAATVMTEGSGYTDAQLTTITVGGTTAGSGASASISVNSFGVVTAVSIINGGSGYTKGVRVLLTSVTGAGAELSAVISNGVITSVSIVEGGIGYDALDTVNFFLGGAILLPIISRVTGSIERVKIIDAGVGYSTAPTLTVVDAQNLGSGKYGNTKAVLQAIEYQGSIVAVNIIDPGKNYSVDNATSISIQGDGDNARFTPVVLDGKVVDVLVENPGTGYTNIVLTVQAPLGSGATVRGVITQSDYTSKQSVVEQTAIKGAIFNIVIESGGSQYSQDTTCVIEGNGTGCVAQPVVVDGVIKRVNILSFGSGYDWATVTFVDPFRPFEQIGSDTVALARAILPPNGGHGKDAPGELMSDTVVINTPLAGDVTSGAQAIMQDYRTFGILKNPTATQSGFKYTKQSALLAYKMACSDTSGVIRDAVYTIADNKFRVVDFVANGFVYFTPLDRTDFAPRGVLIDVENQENQIVTNEALATFDMDKYSGKLLYVSTEVPFEFSEAQSITIKTYIKF